ncbi:unnamed protein product [Mycena citricolor]|uniref:Zn(2)-C6 fungal-type domain-containing protein n=1 Tax=Mycena citricolor TaxID=2018698 RepID=A0AAD2H1U9_9AGAR|nr:unnamed protein product [Mycena citricolor]
MPASQTLAPVPGGEEDRRKRRRNRTTHSCLNCHATKRMCDRKRPCTRCVQSGMASHCTYQTDAAVGFDPTPKHDKSALLARIAELERMVEELRASTIPHTQREEPRNSTAESGRGHTMPDTCPSVPAEHWLRHAPERELSFTSPHPSSHSSGQAPGYLESIFPPYSNEISHGNLACHCLSGADHHCSAMELSSRLRRAADILNLNNMTSVTKSTAAPPPQYLDAYMTGMRAFRKCALLSFRSS